MRYRPVYESAEVQSFVQAIVDDHQLLLTALGLEQPKIVFVEGLRTHVARYVLKSSPPFLILLDYRLVARAAQKFGLDFADELEATLLHEYGHCYLDRWGISGKEPLYEEDLAERFAQLYQADRDGVPAKALLDDYVHNGPADRI